MNVTVSISASAVLGGTNTSICAAGINATSQASVVKVSCNHVTGRSSWRYVHVQRFTSVTTGVSFGLAEIRVMRGGKQVLMCMIWPFVHLATGGLL